MNSTHEQIYQAVCRIPEGKVATYGQIAVLAGLPGQARLTGYALHRCPAEREIPWHRVINAKGCISALPDPDSRMLQQKLLEAEGVVFDKTGKVDLGNYQWAG